MHTRQNSLSSAPERTGDENRSPPEMILVLSRSQKGKEKHQELYGKEQGRLLWCHGTNAEFAQTLKGVHNPDWGEAVRPGKVEQDQQLEWPGGCGGIFWEVQVTVCLLSSLIPETFWPFCVLLLFLEFYVFAYLVFYFILGTFGVHCWLFYSVFLGYEAWALLAVLTGMQWDKQGNRLTARLTDTLRTSHEAHADIFCGEFWPQHFGVAIPMQW